MDGKLVRWKTWDYRIGKTDSEMCPRYDEAYKAKFLTGHSGNICVIGRGD